MMLAFATEVEAKLPHRTRSQYAIRAVGELCLCLSRAMQRVLCAEAWYCMSGTESAGFCKLGLSTDSNTIEPE